MFRRAALMTICFSALCAAAHCEDTPPSLQDQAANTWVNRSPLASTPPSPRLGYEGACAWDQKHRVLIRYGGHNQGGGGEQNSEVWTFDLETARWKLHDTNTAPPGICCGQQNVYDPIRGRYIRFPAFSGSHGWQWAREIYLNDSSIWTFDVATSTWRNMRPLPTPTPRPLRCASWDSDHGVVVLFGGEGSQEGTLVYDPHRNSWDWKKPAVQPEPRSGGNLVYDSRRRRHLLFGSQFNNDRHTWAYDLARNVWTDLPAQELPPTEKNDAVAAFDPRTGLVLALVKITEGEDDQARHRLESWSFDGDRNEWHKLNPPQEPAPSGSRARVLSFAPELNLAILENRTHAPQGPAEQQIWTYRFPDRSPTGKSDAETRAPATPTGPPIVEDVIVSVRSAQLVELSWTPPPGAELTYHVERAVVEVLTEDQLKPLKSRTPVLDPPAVGAIRRIGHFTRLTASPIATTTFKDVSLDLQQRAAMEGEPIYERKFHDDQLDAGGKPYRFGVYAYRVLAVNSQNEVSGPSPAMFTIPSSPQMVFSQEADTSCRLRWAANAEAGVQGYRVYRMDGRYDNQPIVRLTPDALAETTFVDPQAGKAARRYHIVAVDGLGQEGFPSSPVWYNREWQDFYKPFIGEWHQ